MVVSSRAIAAVGIGLGVLASTALGQGAPQDGAMRKAASPSPGQGQGQAPAKPAAPVPAVFGTVDMEAVFKNYDKVRVQQDEFSSAVKAKQADLMRIQAEAQSEAEKLPKLTPNSVDAKKIEDHLTQLKAQIEAGREQAQRDFALKESEMLATLYREIQDMVRRIAEYRQMTYVVQVSNEPVSGSNPNSVMAAMAKTVVYADPRNDITRDVIYNLNNAYKRAGGVAPRAAAAGTNPAGN
jgi:outer membrane protein